MLSKKRNLLIYITYLKLLCYSDSSWVLVSVFGVNLVLVVGYKNNNTSFGWCHSTHRLLTKVAVKKINKCLSRSAKFDYALLYYSCTHPDFTKANISQFGHGHFADVDNLSTDPPDAYTLTIRYTNKVLAAHARKQYKKRDDYLGYALHFLQDMLNPYHTKYERLVKNHPKRILHRNFEKMAEGLQEVVIKNVNIDENKYADPFFDKSLLEAMRKSKNMLQEIKEKKYLNISEMVVKALDNTHKTTDLYFQKLIAEFASATNKNTKIKKKAA